MPTINLSGRKRAVRSVISQLSPCFLLPFTIQTSPTFRWFGVRPNSKGSSNCVMISSQVLTGKCQCVNHTPKEPCSTKASQLRKLED